jgi:hypothetical protein
MSSGLLVVVRRGRALLGLRSVSGIERRGAAGQNPKESTKNKKRNYRRDEIMSEDH